ncbi:MAG: hypothetical protein JNK33_01415 [Candidatus Doudnabacteria bacterium]|nr:hypothetical protein [Candidatus Doudnabacteria bacterium]
MFWKTKSKNTQPNQEQVAQPGASAAEQPFFNVMPKTRVTMVPEPSPAKLSPLVATIPKVEPVVSQPVVSSPQVVQQPPSQPREIRVTTPPPSPVIPPPVVTSSPDVLPPSGSPVRATKKIVKIIAVVFCVVLAGFAVWYASQTLGSGGQGGGVTALLQRLPFLGGKTTTTPPPTGQPTPPPSGEPEPPLLFGTTAEWREQYFTTATCDAAQCGDVEDPDTDGLTNLKEFQIGSNPTSADSDADGLADGDEVNVFGCSPLDMHTAGDAAYTDADDLKGGWDCGRPAGSADKMTEEKLLEIQTQAKAHPLHAGTLSVLGEMASRYQPEPESGTTAPEAHPTDVPAQLPSGFDSAPEALLERDLQRLGTIKKVGVALVKYQNDNKAVPDVPDFASLVLKLKAYITVATNAQDPVNKAPFVYTYGYLQDGQDFDLTYYSETQKQLIRYTSAQAKKDADAEGAVSRDGQRVQDLEKIRSALLIYSAATVQSSKSFNFPQAGQYKQKMVPQYMKALPVDPSTGQDYEYSAAKDGATFTLRVALENPASGTSGYACNQDACQTY